MSGGEVAAAAAAAVAVAAAVARADHGGRWRRPAGAGGPMPFPEVSSFVLGVSGVGLDLIELLRVVIERGAPADPRGSPAG